MARTFSLRGKSKRFLSLVLALVLVAAAGGGAYYTHTQQTAEVLSKMGSRGEEVRQIQQKLKNLGYFTSAVDGIYGTRTQTAVRNFQRDNGLAVDGIVSEPFRRSGSPRARRAAGSTAAMMFICSPR